MKENKNFLTNIFSKNVKGRFSGRREMIPKKNLEHKNKGSLIEMVKSV
jgi:hypothetical protein